MGQAVFRDISDFAPKKSFFPEKIRRSRTVFFAPNRFTAARSICYNNDQKPQKASSPHRERMLFVENKEEAGVCSESVPALMEKLADSALKMSELSPVRPRRSCR